MFPLSLRPARSLIGAFTAAALGLGALLATPAPVRADNYDAGRIIAGAVALGVVGAAIHDAKKDRREDERRREAERRWHDQREYRHDRDGRRGQNCVRTRGGDVECGAPIRRNQAWHKNERRHDHRRGEHRQQRHGWHHGPGAR